MKKTFALFIFAFAVAAGLSSCTLIGYGIGSVIDNGNAHGKVAIFTDIDDYGYQTASIIYPDSSVRYALYIGYSDEPVENYHNAYDTYLKSHSGDSASIPFGKTVVAKNFIGDNVTKYSGLFGGYYPEGMLIDDEKLNFGKFDSLISPKHLSAAQLKAAFESNTIPIRATLNFQTEGNKFSLTNRDFQNVMIMPHSTYARWHGLLIGVMLDIAAFALVNTIRISF